jgi:hypothetical protein
VAAKWAGGRGAPVPDGSRQQWEPDKSARSEDEQLYFIQGGCHMLISINLGQHGLRLLDNFVFELDATGRAKAVRARALRQTLQWVGGGE